MEQITLSRKDQVSRLGGSGNEGMIHSVLTGLPEFSDYGKDQNDGQGYEALPHPEPAAIAVEHSNHTAFPEGVDDAPLICKGFESQCNTSEADLHIGAPFSSSTQGSSLSPVVGEAASDAPACSPPPDDEDTPGAPVVSDDASVPHAVPQPGIVISIPASGLDPSDIPLPPSAAATPTTSPTRVASPTRAGPHRSPTPYSLLSVFLLADELFARFPPNTPELRVTRTLGPASAMRTWSQDAALLPSDDQAEALVVAAVDIVVSEALGPDPKTQKELRQMAKKRGVGKAKSGEAKLLIAGAVLVLGVAVAFSVHARHGGGLGKGREAEWRTLFGALGALGERVLGVFDDAQLWL
jgi:TBC1 domain family member 20